MNLGKIRGKKLYGIVNPEHIQLSPILLTETIEEAEDKMDKIFTILVELEVTKVFAYKQELIES